MPKLPLSNPQLKRQNAYQEGNEYEITDSENEESQYGEQQYEQQEYEQPQEAQYDQPQEQPAKGKRKYNRKKPLSDEDKILKQLQLQKARKVREQKIKAKKAEELKSLLYETKQAGKGAVALPSKPKTATPTIPVDPATDMTQMMMVMKEILNSQKSESKPPKVVNKIYYPEPKPKKEPETDNAEMIRRELIRKMTGKYPN